MRLGLPRNLSFPGIAQLREPKVMVRAGLGFLLVANLVAAAFAFHLIGTSPDALNQQVIAATVRKQAALARLSRSRALAGNIQKGKGEGEKFIAGYMSSRRYTSSIILGELTEIAKAAGMKMEEGTFAAFDPIEGSEDLDMMTVSVNFEGGNNELLKLINLLDRSQRFLILESLTVTPRPKGDVLTVNIRLNTFVKDDRDGAS